MACPDCGGETISIPVPAELREYLPGEAPGTALCRACLSIHPDPDPPAETPDLSAVDDAFPTDSDAAVPLALLVGLLDSLALNRQEITALLERVEREGVDPLLAVDRLADSYGDRAHVDLSARRRQLEQLL